IPRHRAAGDRAAGHAAREWLLLGLFHVQRRFHLDDELDLLAHHDAATGDRHVGGYAVLGAVDLPGSREAGLGAAEGIGAEAVDLERERDRVRDPANSQLAVHNEVLAILADAGRAVRHRRVVGRVEEVLAGHITVTVLVAGVDRGRVDGHRGRRLHRVIRRDDLALELGEVPADLADHQVARDKADMRMAGIDVPGSGDVAGDLDSLCRHGVSFSSQRYDGYWIVQGINPEPETILVRVTMPRKTALQAAPGTWR